MKAPLRSLKARAFIFLGLLFACVLSVAIFLASERRLADFNYALERLDMHAQRIAEKQSDVIRFTQQFLAVMVETGSAHSLAAILRIAGTSSTNSKIFPRMPSMF